jgi:hypothetical protein
MIEACVPVDSLQSTVYRQQPPKVSTELEENGSPRRCMGSPAARWPALWAEPKHLHRFTEALRIRS